MKNIILENHKRYLERINFYKKFCYDIEKERRFILEKAKPLCGQILEIGTGKGYFTVLLAKHGYQFTTVDISEEEQEFACMNIKYLELEKNVDFKIGNAESLSFEDKSFDTIISVNTAHHLNNPFKVLDELIRIVSFEGKIVLSDFTKEGLGVVDKIHLSEGRKHQVSKVKLNDITDYLKRRKFLIEKHSSMFQEVPIAYQPIV